LDSRSRRPADVIELSGLRADVILRVIAVQLLAAYEVLKVDMPARFRIACFGVVIQLVRAQQHVGGLQPDVASQMPDDAHGVLRHGFDMDVLRVGRTRAREGKLLIGIGAQGSRRIGRGVKQGDKLGPLSGARQSTPSNKMRDKCVGVWYQRLLYWYAAAGNQYSRGTVRKPIVAAAGRTALKN
jgi:hypothetical protein